MRAIVDIGSNSIKYLVAKMQRGKMDVLKHNSQVTGLGRGLAQNGLLLEDTVEASLQTLRSFKREIDEICPETEIDIVATAAVRDAQNSRVISDGVQEIFQTKLRVLKGEEEALLSMKGASTARSAHTKLSETLFADIGGASTEIGFLEPEYFARSTRLGAVRTHQLLGFSKNAIDDESWEKAYRFVKNEIQREFDVGEIQRLQSKNNIIAVGGTLVMAAKSIPSHEIYPDTYQVDPSIFFQKIEELRKMTEDERLQHPDIVKGRADILPCGMLILKVIIEVFSLEQLIVTTRGIRHGVFLEQSQK